jgi:dUTP pyrophosphatase
LPLSIEPIAPPAVLPAADSTQLQHGVVLGAAGLDSSSSEPALGFYLTADARERGLLFKPPRPQDAGFDLQSLEEVEIEPNNSRLIRTGLHLAIPEGWVGLVRDRSSVAMRGGVISAGVIDSAYRGEVKVLMHNFGSEPLRFSTGERFAQCLILPHLEGRYCVEARELDELGETERGPGGFGSTGI